MSIIMFVVGLALVVFGLIQRGQGAPQQVNVAIYVVGGIIVLGVGALLMQMERRRSDERFKLKAQEPDVAAKLEEKEASDRRFIAVALVMLACLCAFIGYKWTHAG